MQYIELHSHTGLLLQLQLGAEDLQEILKIYFMLIKQIFAQVTFCNTLVTYYNNLKLPKRTKNDQNRQKSYKMSGVHEKSQFNVKNKPLLLSVACNNC